MPLQRGKDSQGPYYRWGSRGKKFHYKEGDRLSRKSARGRAMTDRKRIEFFKRKK